jgi:hypothetical protein
MGCRFETRQTKHNRSEQGTAGLTRTKLPPHARLNFREGQRCFNKVIPTLLAYRHHVPPMRDLYIRTELYLGAYI